MADCFVNTLLAKVFGVYAVNVHFQAAASKSHILFLGRGPKAMKNTHVPRMARIRESIALAQLKFYHAPQIARLRDRISQIAKIRENQCASSCGIRGPKAM